MEQQVGTVLGLVARGREAPVWPVVAAWKRPTGDGQQAEGPLEPVLPWGQEEWPCGLMDKASDFGSEDCKFESCHGRGGEIFFFAAPVGQSEPSGVQPWASLVWQPESRDRIVVSTLRCGRSNPGSNPGHGIEKQCHGPAAFHLFAGWLDGRRWKKGTCLTPM